VFTILWLLHETVLLELHTTLLRCWQDGNQLSGVKEDKLKFYERVSRLEKIRQTLYWPRKAKTPPKRGFLEFGSSDWDRLCQQVAEKQPGVEKTSCQDHQNDHH